MIFKLKLLSPKLVWILITLGLTLAIGLSWYRGFSHPDRFLPDDNDSLLITYIISQSQINFTDPAKPRFWASFFAPFPDTLRYSDSFTTSALLTLPFAGQSPLVSYNGAALMALLLTSLSTFLLIQHLTGSNWLGLVGALMFNFSGFHWHYFPHLQMFGLWTIPLSFYFFLCWQEQRQIKFLICLLLTLTAQVAESFFLFYVALLGLLILAITNSVCPKKNESWLIALFGLIWLSFALPYGQLTSEFAEARRSIREAANFSLGPDEVLPKYQGYFLTLFTFISLPNLKERLRPFIFLLVAGLVMSLGPVLKLEGITAKFFSLPIPLPYALFYYLVPGFSGFRTPGRWIVLAALSAVVLICLALSRVRSSSLKFSLSIVFVVLVIASTQRPQSIAVDLRPPAVYNQVKQLPANAVILELPIKLWSQPGSQIESQRSLYSLYHQHRRLNGYSGFAPYRWIELVQQINDEGLTSKVVAGIKLWGVTHIVSDNQLRPL